MRGDDGWTWDGGHPAIDLVNTVRHRQLEPLDTLPDDNSVTAWLTAAGLLHETTPTRTNDADLTRDAHQRRAAIEGILGIRRLEPQAIETINHWIRQAPGPQLTLGAEGTITTNGADRAPASTPRTALATIALSVFDLVQSGDYRAVKKCSYDRCGLRFLDTNPRRERSWCSMRRCGNRAKARRHAQRVEK